ncbi:MAG: sterol carrier protein domain-containing protein [Blastocatellia bacterium]|nr:sterol carrier protein domain-containing protein [Blastocatellia bacterium]
MRRFKVGSKEDLELVKQCYQRFVERKNFMTEELDSGWELWQKNLEKRKFICMIFEDESTIQGYVTYHFDKAESMVKQSINISELIYDNNRAYQGLMGFISSLSDQITEVIYCAHPDEGFHFLLKNPRDCNDPLIDNGMLSRTGYYSVSYMMRVLDVAGALNARPNYNGVTGKVIFEIIDPQLEGNNRNFCLELLNGKPTVSQVGNDPDSRKNLIKLDISLFSQLYSGALSATRAAFFGQIEASNNETLLLLDEIFKLEKPFLLEQF